MGQSDFADACGVKRIAQSNYENDKRNPDSLYLMAAAKLGVDVNYLITGVPSQPRDSIPVEAQNIINMVRDMHPEDRESFLKVGEALSQPKPNKNVG